MEARVDWQSLRTQMPITRQWVYLDHAAVAPITAPALAALTEWGSDIAQNGAVHHSQWRQRVEEVRRLAGRLLNADPADIAFIKNTSEGVGIVAEGVRWQPGDNVVTAAEEYPANIYPWMNLADRGVELRTVASRTNRLELDDIRAAIDNRTRVLTVSQVEFSSGFRNDLDSLGELCRSRDVFFFVDAIQGLGVFPIDVQTTSIDFLAADGHKWLLGPEGAGLLYIRRECVDRLHPVDIGWNSVVNSMDFSQIDFTLKSHAGRFESGTLPFGNIVALGASLGLLLEIGIDKVRDRVLLVTDYLCEQSARAGWPVFSSRSIGDKSGIVALESVAADLRGFIRTMRQKGIVINQRAGRVRISPHCYNTIEEVDRLVEELRIRKQAGASL
jgi:cysteine desulfurase / selenocysteine lyase